MAELPSREDIDAMVELIGGPNAEFYNLPPADRMQIIALVNQSDLIAELANVVERLDNLDVELTKAGDWFKHSKTYEGR